MDSYSDLGLWSRPQVMDLMSYAICYHPWIAMATGLYPISLVIGMIPTRDKVLETLMRIHGSSNGWSGPRCTDLASSSAGEMLILVEVR